MEDARIMRLTEPFAVLTLLAMASCAAAPTWRGKITDCKTTKPIDDVDVQLAVSGPRESKTTDRTSTDGTFAFAAPGATKESTATMTATKKGYQVTQASLGVAPGSTDPICMEPTR
jgi:hypothetical protein